ncbi:MAG: dephospho-CoA kinase [Candidatus Hecatellales archaeon]|nr:MAG: dephospho-CoA kinase [Candidatus Hecatellales archaeon]
MRRKVVGVVGMPGSGKTTLAEAAREVGFRVVTMGDFVRAEAERRGLKPTAENLGSLMFKLRREGGEAILAKLTSQAIEALDDKLVLIDGVRSPAEVEEFREKFPGFKLIAVKAPSRLRFERLTGRERSDDPKAWKEFRRRDLREIKVGVSLAMKQADVSLENLGGIGEFKASALKVLKELVKDC